MFGSTREFLQHKPKDTVSCLVLDVSLPGVSGLDFQAQLAGTHADIPIIFLSGHVDERMSVRALKAGAVEFLTKPVREQDLLDAINVAFERDRTRRANEEMARALSARFQLLSDCEREVMSLVITGMLNTQIAGGRSPASRARRSTWASAARALASGKDGTAAPHKAKAAEGGRRLWY